MKALCTLFALTAVAIAAGAHAISQTPPPARGFDRPDVSKSALPKNGPSAIIATVAGDGFLGEGGDGGPAASAQLAFPESVAADSQGNFYIPDYYGQVVRKVTASTGVISVYAGTGIGGYAGDGERATKAELDEPEFVAIDSDDNLYISDSRNNVVRKVSAKTGIITTVAGNGNGARTPGPDTCGALNTGIKATATSLCFPRGLAVDGSGNLFIAQDYQIYKVTAATGIISLYAGGNCCGYSGDGGPAVDAEFEYLNGLATDSEGNLYIADTSNCAIRKVTAATGIITSLVGTKNTAGTYGECNYGANPGDGGPASSATILDPYTIAVDGSGNIFIADSSHYTIRMISASNGNIYTVAGTYAVETYGNTTDYYGDYGYLGDGGPAAYAQLAFPEGVAVSPSGNLYIADTENNVIREVTNAAVLPTEAPVISPAGGLIAGSTQVTLTGPAGSTIYFTTNGSIPTASSHKYTGSITVGKTEIVTAFATIPNEPNTPATIVDYFYAPAPVISPSTKDFKKSLSVTMTDANASAQIYYTTDNSNIGLLGPGVKKYTGPITLAATTTVSAAVWTYARNFAGDIVGAWSPVTTRTYTLSADEKQAGVSKPSPPARTQ
jgi:sugar lactone lactonase YvrE